MKSIALTVLFVFLVKMWMSALIQITVNLGSVSTQMDLSAVNVRMVTSYKELNVWVSIAVSSSILKNLLKCKVWH